MPYIEILELIFNVVSTNKNEHKTNNYINIYVNIYGLKNKTCYKI